MPITMETITGKFGFIVSAIKWVGKWIRDKERLASSIIVTPCPKAEALTINCATGDVSFWLRISNFSAFDMRTNHCVIRLIHAGFSVQLQPDRQYIIPAFGYKDVLVNSMLTPEQTKAVANSNVSYNDPIGEFNMTLTFKTRHLDRYGSLEGIPFYKMNAPQQIKA